MNAVAQVAAGVAGLVHVVVWVFESFLMDRPAVHRGVFKLATKDLPAIRLWSFNVGFYNLFLGGGTILGLVLLHTGAETAGRALVLYTCAFMALAGIVLAISDALALGRPRGTGWTGALGQFLPPAVALAAALL
ncbi:MULTISPECIES: DUF1304 domain-containing protein [unclassified Saccharothrix]|uniref:DUF1304 domain-containing protein n=1 Tax=unclassified Saccharothrix TaxID=2593673 RepID=UPI00307F721B